MATSTAYATYPQPRDTVYDWFLRPGSQDRMSPPGWSRDTSGSRDLLAEGDESTVRMAHPALSTLPGLKHLPLGTATARLTRLVPGERQEVTIRSGRKTFTQETTFTDDDSGGTQVATRIAGNMSPAAAESLGTQARFWHEQAAADLALQDALGWPAPRTVVVAGSSGLVGTQLVALLRMAGHRVVRLVRRDPSGPDEERWAPTRHELPPGLLERADAVVNLAGHTIGGRFTDENKRLILQSRLDATATLADALAASPSGKTLVQASAIGVYGARRPGETLTEEAASGGGFLADVVTAWERAAAPAVAAGVNTAFLRTGIVQSYGGGALQRQVPLYLAGVGGRLGPADAALSWIDLDDLVRAYVHAIFTPSLVGATNAVAPNPVTNGAYAETLGRVLRRPAAVPTPSFGPKLLLGEEGYDQLIATDQNVSAAKLQASGFAFAYPSLEEALRHAVMRGTRAAG